MWTCAVDHAGVAHVHVTPGGAGAKTRDFLQSMASRAVMLESNTSLSPSPSCAELAASKGHLRTSTRRLAPEWGPLGRGGNAAVAAPLRVLVAPPAGPRPSEPAWRGGEMASSVPAWFLAAAERLSSPSCSRATVLAEVGKALRGGVALHDSAHDALSPRDGVFVFAVTRNGARVADLVLRHAVAPASVEELLLRLARSLGTQPPEAGSTTSTATARDMDLEQRALLTRLLRVAMNFTRGAISATPNRARVNAEFALLSELLQATYADITIAHGVREHHFGSGSTRALLTAHQRFARGHRGLVIEYPKVCSNADLGPGLKAVAFSVSEFAAYYSSRARE